MKPVMTTEGKRIEILEAELGGGCEVAWEYGHGSLPVSLVSVDRDGSGYFLMLRLETDHETVPVTYFNFDSPVDVNGDEPSEKLYETIVWELNAEPGKPVKYPSQAEIVDMARATFPHWRVCDCEECIDRSVQCADGRIQMNALDGRDISGHMIEVMETEGESGRRFNWRVSRFREKGKNDCFFGPDECMYSLMNTSEDMNMGMIDATLAMMLLSYGAAMVKEKLEKAKLN